MLPFDSSSSSILLRWDLLHFQKIAQDGYEFEHLWAFMPTVPFIIRTLNNLPLLSLFIVLLAVDQLRTLHELSLLVLRDKKQAKIATILAFLPASPVTLFLVAYNEPFFTYFSYKGMLYCERKQWFRAALAFTFASCFRSNGIFLAGFLGWTFSIYPTILSLLVVAPFLYHNYSAYSHFCTVDVPPAWCSKTIPLIYSHVQEKYWNVGLFRYWTLSQLPNFLLAAPPLVLLVSFSVRHLLNHRSNSRLTPHAIHALFVSALLIFASHTQIALRLAPSLPILYWGAADLWKTHRRLAKAWVYWSAIWGSISVVLWLAFLPPA